MSGTSIIRKRIWNRQKEKCRPCSNEYLNRGLISVLNLISNTLIKNDDAQERKGKKKGESFRRCVTISSRARYFTQICLNLLSTTDSIN